MSYSIIDIQGTPNPYARKCVLDRVIAGCPQSFLSPADAEGHVLAGALFAAAPITTILFCDSWLTINKDPDSSWKEVTAAVRRVLAETEYEAGQEAST